VSAHGDLLLIGRIGRPHGVRGELKVQPITDDPGRFEELDRVFVGFDPATAAPIEVDGVRYQYPSGETIVLLALAGVDDRDAADALRNANVYAAAQDLPLGADEMFLHDLIGLTVFRTDDAGRPVGEPIGSVRDVMEGAAQDLIVIARPGQPDALLPDVPEFVIEVDTEAGRLMVRPPVGLLEDGDGDR
jgi:16S rRNA processing protein RimM